MITAKFGGTAITPHNLVYLKKILTPNHKVVVVSAIGKSHPNDVKTTDLLATYYHTHDQSVWRMVCARYKRLATVNCININVDKLLADAHNRALEFNFDYCISLGEELSAKLVSAYLNATYVEAQDVLLFGKKGLKTKQTISRLKSAFLGANLAVIGGFYGGWTNTRKTFSRGGSDVTASFCALATNSTLCENWTDSSGVCQGNPTEIFGVKTLTHIGYNQMFQLAQAGATVLHPDAIRPLQTKSIPLVVGNFYNPNGPKTVVSNQPNSQKLLCVTQKKQKDNFVVTVVHNMLQGQVFSCLGNLYTFLGAQTKCSIKSILCSERTVTIVCKANILQQVFDCFSMM